MTRAAAAVAIVCLLSVRTDAQTAPPSFSTLRAAAVKLPRLHSLVVSHRGTIVFEHYAKGFSATRPANVKSVSKSVISTLVGIAIDRGLIRGADEPIATFFPELRRDPDRRKHAITVEHLLTMRSGLETTSNRNYGAWVRSRNWVTHALTRPLVSDPGSSMEYSTGSSHLLSAILTKVSKASTLQFAQSAIGQPLGIRIAPWPRDPQGIYFGGNDMLLTPRQMIAFGELHLNEGRVQGKQIVPATWVRTSCVPRTRSRFDSSREYGYGWWIDEIGGRESCYAWGFGGQFVLVFDELDLVIAITSSTTDSDERRGYRRELLELIGREVVAALE